MTTVKTALLLLAIVWLLAGAAAAAPVPEPQPLAGGLSCSPALEPVCLAYDYYCRNYLHHCPVD